MTIKFRHALLSGLIIIVALASFLVGHFRTKSVIETLATAGESQQFNNKSVIMVSAPTINLGQLNFLVKLADRPTYYRATSKNLVTGKPGDALIVDGMVKPFKTDTDNSRSFTHYYQSKMIAGDLSVSGVKSIREAPWYSFRSFVYDTQRFIYGLADRLLPYPHNILTLGVLVGRDDFPADLKTTLRTAGLSHIAVLSGFNLSIVVVALYAIYAGRYRYLKTALGIASAVILTAISGFGASALRALVMVMIAIYAKWSGRTYLAFRALLLAVVVLSLWRPLMFLYDAGFQLSVLATLGLIAFANHFQIWLVEHKWSPGFAELVAGTLAAELMVLPWLSFAFGQVATYGLLANVLVLPAVPILMALGALLVGVGSVSVLLAYPLSLITYAVSGYIITVASLTASLPFSLIGFNLTFVWVIMWYVALFGYWFFRVRVKS
jgi:ComEC/Rec2-related protein